MPRKSQLAKAARKVVVRADAAITDAAGKARKAIRQREKKQTGIKEAVLAAGTAALAGLAVEQAGRALRSRRGAAPLGFDVTLPVGLESAIERVGSALKAEGFGILTRIDVHTTLRDKLGLTFRPYAILGACNPALAHRALSARAEAGLLLPCNITVEELPEHTTLIRFADPEVMLRLLGEDSALQAPAKEARERLQRAAGALREHAAAVVL
jgi:uncharacterized protein (DUF302 family)